MTLRFDKSLVGLAHKELTTAAFFVSVPVRPDGGMVYTGDLKSPARKGLRVRVPLRVPETPQEFLRGLSLTRKVFCDKNRATLIMSEEAP